MILGVDPGLTGGLALLSEDGGLLFAMDMPVVDKNVDSTGLYHLLQAYLWENYETDGLSQAVVERVSSMPGQGVASVFKFGKGYGQVLGVLSAMEIPVADPTPSQWKREMGLSAVKELSRAVAIKIWPAQAELFVRKKDADRAEAALLALWWIQKHRWGIQPGVHGTREPSTAGSRSGRVLKRR